MIIFKQTAPDTFELDKQSLSTLSRLGPTLRKMNISKNTIYTTNEDFRGANGKFWVSNKDVPEGLLFKYPQQKNSEELLANNYGELLVDLICESLAMEHTNYYPCKVVLLNGQTLEGTLSPSYRSPQYDTEYSAQNITTRYMQSQYDNNYGYVAPMEHNTVYEYLKQIKLLYPKWVQNVGIKQLKDNLLRLALLDFATLQIDRHWGNFGFLNNSSKGMRSIKMIPTFDNGCSFNTDKPLVRVEALNRSLHNTKNWDKRIIIPMVTGKENAPLLGIKTSLVQVKDNTVLVNRKYKAPEKSNVDIFLDEITDEIMQNPDLERFYKKMLTLNAEEIFTKSGYFPDYVTNIASKLWNARVNLLQKSLEDKRSVANER